MLSSPTPRDHLGADLLVATAEQVPLAADRRDDDLAGRLVEIGQKVALRRILPQQIATINDVDAQRVEASPMWSRMARVVLPGPMMETRSAGMLPGYVRRDRR